MCSVDLFGTRCWLQWPKAADHGRPPACPNSHQTAFSNSHETASPHPPTDGLPFRAWRNGWGHCLCAAVLQQLRHRQARQRPGAVGCLAVGRERPHAGSCHPPPDRRAQPHCSTLAPAGAQLRQWYLAGTATGDIQSQDASLALLSPAAATNPSGSMAAVFTLQQGASQSPLPLIFAAGGVYNDGTMRWAKWPNLGADGLQAQGKPACGSRPAAAGLGCAVAPQSQHLHLHASSSCRQHSQYGSGTLDLSTGTLSDPEVETDPISSIIAVGRCSAFLFLTGSADPWVAWSAPSDQACVW